MIRASLSRPSAESCWLAGILTWGESAIMLPGAWVVPGLRAAELAGRYVLS